ncbi:Splicing factor 3B subunit 4 [Gracilariopsis chorda]|uniref:Splicing factor 3B subunit 4 n=1 Tax=Gracilariopsis chorda TaxID=448386 RepID=A0A2V3IVS2_9FLOR|nr:Splicing factor 3B subunit 4 [Gracilariopsis chorda]|eukprot:PXF46246.1 Splicing factor 3B subunit 4 [Gracilariopsis chorda]
MAATLASNRNPTDRNADATVHIAQLDEKVTDALLWELMVQAAPVRHVYIPRNRITGDHFGYGFCEFHTPLDALYAAKVLNWTHLYTKPIRISQSTVDRRNQDIGANLFIGNLVDEVDEKLLHDAFSAFGPLVEAPFIMRDPNTNQSKRYGFVKYSCFEHSDAAIAAMNGQYVCNTPITVQYAFKKDSDKRERHGSQAERILAAKGAEARRTAELENKLRPHTHFSDKPPKRISAESQLRPPAPYPGYPPGGYAAYPSHHPDYHAQPQVPNWARAPPQQYASVPPVGEFAHRGMAETSHIGWSTNRQFGSRTHTGRMPPYPQQQAPRARAPRPVPDEAAPVYRNEK